MEINSYGKVHHYKHPHLGGRLFNGTFVVQEKIDGSQISWYVENGQLFVRSHNKQLYLDCVEKMFQKGVAELLSLKDTFTEGYTYRGEYLSKPHHNHVVYERVPKHNIIMFDIMTDIESYLPPAVVAAEAARVGMEVVPTYYDGFTCPEKPTEEALRGFLTGTPILGGDLIEGVVIKNYTIYALDGKLLKGKLVNEKYSEKARKDGNLGKANGASIIDSIVESYNKEARWQKAVQHLTEDGDIIGAPEDIGKIMKEIHLDLRDEETEEIKEALFKWAWPTLSRKVAAGFPEWYKRQLEEAVVECA